ncbi:MAG: glucosidase [Phycisphaeraceae bacterium]
MARKPKQNAETRRLGDDAKRKANWKRWGPYLSERQWGTVREDYSQHGNCWDYFPHDHARSRAYRWGEDGLFGWTDRECRMCFSLALWNGKDPILKERLFGLTGPEGNHGEDVKECYYYLDSTPTYSYAKALYKYPQCEYPYARLVKEGGPARGKIGELELIDLGVFEDNRYFDVFTEYAKDSADDTLIRITVHNRGPEEATLHVIPQLWFRNTWAWGRVGEGSWPKGHIKTAGTHNVVCEHTSLGYFHLAFCDGPDRISPQVMFTENETNYERLYNTKSPSPYVKDAFHDAVIHGKHDCLSAAGAGTKVGLNYELLLPPGGEATIRLRLCAEDAASPRPLGKSFDHTFTQRIIEADEYYNAIIPSRVTGEARNVARQAYAGLLWTKQFYHYVVKDWLEGDPSMPPPPAGRNEGRNCDWQQLFNRDLISMPDKWEYPWYAAWDLAFHMLPFSEIDSTFTKEQLLLFLREWYMHPNGQIPAYEFAFGDVNPPVHAWACWRVYKLTAPRGERDVQFLARTFQKLMLNFTWWVNRKDPRGKNLFSGGFLGLDNIGVFDRSRPLPTGGHLEQADGTAWMAFFCNTMLSMALELAQHDPSYEDIASKFFEHFVHIADAMNTLGGTGLWDGEDGFYYDKLMVGTTQTPLKVRSMVGLIPLLAAENLEFSRIRLLHGFRKRMRWFMENRADLARHISYLDTDKPSAHPHYLLAIPSRERLLSVLKYMLDENEFLSPFGIRSLSKYYEKNPFIFKSNGEEYRVDYTPAESVTDLFGGNSNWRGPIWFPLNYLILEALEKYHHFYGEDFKVECPTGSGVMMSLKEVASEIASRLSRLFLPDKTGARPAHGSDRRYADDPNWKNLVLFYEFFHGDTGRGAGASHQTGWTALVIRCLEKMGR